MPARRDFRVAGPQRAGLRCWLDGKRQLHLGADATGAGRLGAAVSGLRGAPRPGAVTLALDFSPLTRAENPMWFSGVERVFAELRLERVDDPAAVAFFCARAVDGRLAEIRLGSAHIDVFAGWCEQLAAGRLDDFIADSRPPGLSARGWKRLRTLDKQSLTLGFWALRGR